MSPYHSELFLFHSNISAIHIQFILPLGNFPPLFPSSYCLPTHHCASKLADQIKRNQKKFLYCQNECLYLLTSITNHEICKYNCFNGLSVLSEYNTSVLKDSNILLMYLSCLIQFIYYNEPL